MKNDQYINYQANANLPLEILPYIPIRMAKLNLTIPTVDKDVEFSLMAGRNVKCYNHFRKLFSDFF